MNGRGHVQYAPFYTRAYACSRVHRHVVLNGTCHIRSTCTFFVNTLHVVGSCVDLHFTSSGTVFVTVVHVDQNHPCFRDHPNFTPMFEILHKMGIVPKTEGVFSLRSFFDSFSHCELRSRTTSPRTVCFDCIWMPWNLDCVYDALLKTDTGIRSNVAYWKCTRTSNVATFSTYYEAIKCCHLLKMYRGHSKYLFWELQKQALWANVAWLSSSLFLDLCLAFSGRMILYLSFLICLAFSGRRYHSQRWANRLSGIHVSRQRPHVVIARRTISARAHVRVPAPKAVVRQCRRVWQSRESDRWVWKSSECNNAPRARREHETSGTRSLQTIPLWYVRVVFIVFACGYN